jgi:hypothetical protein
VLAGYAKKQSDFAVPGVVQRPTMFVVDGELTHSDEESSLERRIADARKPSSAAVREADAQLEKVRLDKERLDK